jgi:molecular chaperone GrpE
VRGKKGNGDADETEEASGLEAVPSPAPTELEALRAERDELKDQLLRRRADFENYKKRVERDRQQSAQDAVASLLKSLIPTLDNLEKARTHADETDSLKEGLELIYRNLVLALEAVGLESRDPMGERYDPEVHEALSHEEVPGARDNTIVEVFRKGYVFKDRLLRAALVKVAKGGRSETGDEENAVH